MLGGCQDNVSLLACEILRILSEEDAEEGELEADDLQWPPLKK